MPQLPSSPTPFRRRLFLAVLLLAALFAVLLGRIVGMEVLHYRRFRQMAQANHSAIVPLAPARGLILAAHGQVLAGNRARYVLELIPDEVHHLHETLASLERLFPIPPQRMQHLLATLDDKPAYLPRLLMSRMSPAQMARFAVRAQDFPGVGLAVRWHRFYPYSPLFSNVVGYVGPVTAADLQGFDPQKYLYRRHVGLTGLEYAFERDLRGRFGYRILEVNALGDPVAQLRTVPPTPGDTLQTTLRLRVERAVARVMRRYHYRGALVAINPNTGAVLASVSNPSFNANWFVNGIRQRHWQSLLHQPGRPLVDRVAQGLYPPGSTIKPFYALQALQDHVIGPNFHTYCPGFLRVGGHVYWDWYRAGFGETGLTKALAWSVDVFFYKLAMKMGIQRQDQALWRFGFGRPAPIDTPGSSPGFVPTPAWKERRWHAPWYTGDSIILGIGQGYLLVTPLQLVRAVAAIANGGRLPYLHVARALINPLTGRRTLLSVPPAKNLHLPAFALRAVRRGMHACVTRGTCQAVSYPGLSMAGKTGTAEVPVAFKDGRTVYNDDSLFIGWAPYHHPRIAVAAVVEDGGANAWQALPVARAAFLAYLKPHLKIKTFTNIVVNPAQAFG
ncbi:penicillin-binding protein 2 [Acidithiobacillus sp.]|uniref:penicillin-binding protein 2 n=1 Tax=Acidithiobacillus sp. TaxID=1872118 RepID=UPI0025BAEA65|nr:penicillin-binding protein 2 [Acidithiobacillus sp.]